MFTFAKRIQELRQEKGDPLRKVSAFVDIDQAILSKIENGKRIATRENVVRLEEYYNVEKDSLLVLWLSDKIIYELHGEDIADEALRLAEERIRYMPVTLLKTEDIVKKARDYFKNQNKVVKAWLFGSYARGDHDIYSDIDIIVQIPAKKSFTLFDLAEIKHQLEKLIPGKIDVVMQNAVTPEILKRITPELILIYEKSKNH
ncbi:MAG: nucleotidyltransferase domain-containing protein [Bacteroidales bacterium]|jgi:predicted nucleotidyltransferase